MLRPSSVFDAPELKGRAWADAHELFAADIYSLGCLFLYLLTGRPLQPPPPDSAQQLCAMLCTLAVSETGAQ